MRSEAHRNGLVELSAVLAGAVGGRLQADGGEARVEKLRGARLRDAARLGNLLESGEAAVLAHEDAAEVREARRLLLRAARHVDGGAEARVRAQHRLAHPPRGVGGELQAALRLEALHCATEARHALVDEVLRMTTQTLLDCRPCFYGFSHAVSRADSQQLTLRLDSCKAPPDLSNSVTCR